MGFDVSDIRQPYFRGVITGQQCRGTPQDQTGRGVVHPDYECKQFRPLLGTPLMRSQSWGYSVSMMNSLQLTLFHKYAELLKRRFSEDFQEVGENDLLWERELTSYRSSRRTTTCPCR